MDRATGAEWYPRRGQLRVHELPGHLLAASELPREAAALRRQRAVPQGCLVLPAFGTGNGGLLVRVGEPPPATSSVTPTTSCGSPATTTARSSARTPPLTSVLRSMWSRATAPASSAAGVVATKREDTMDSCMWIMGIQQYCRAHDAFPATAYDGNRRYLKCAPYSHPDGAIEQIEHIARGVAQGLTDALRRGSALCHSRRGGLWAALTVWSTPAPR